ncbi:MAG: ribonuclease Z [candidate division KSB1 bacterium]|nr:ribonuclease Z [candidate division KSB1 bacterium]
MTDLLRLHFLGTGAAAPSPSRRAPCLAIQRENEIILLDAGEGFQVRLQQARLSAAKVQAVIISHLHGDHLFGLPGFLTSQQLFQRTAPLTLYGPAGLSGLLDWIASLAKYTIDFPLKVVELTEPLHRFDVGSFRVTARLLEHSAPCYGYRLEEPEKPGVFDTVKAAELGIPEGPERQQLKRGLPVNIDGRFIRPEEVVGPSTPGRVIAYCTDTLPCGAGMELAMNCDALIHDATFSDRYAERAVASFHSTSRQAACLARAAGARRLFLWHLSIRVHGEEEGALLQEAREEFAPSFLPNDLEWFDLPRREEG